MLWKEDDAHGVKAELPSPCLPTPAAPWSGGIPPVWHGYATACDDAADTSVGCLGFPHRAPQ